jgi:hypothetical protein
MESAAIKVSGHCGNKMVTRSPLFNPRELNAFANRRERSCTCSKVIRHSAAGCFDQQGGATRSDVPVANYIRNVELRREYPTGNWRRPPDMSSRQAPYPISCFLAQQLLVFTTGSNIRCQDRPPRERDHRHYQFGETGHRISLRSN